MLALYDSPISGNCYKVRLLLSHLGLEYRRIDVDVLNRGSRPAELLEKNPAGRVPLLVLPDGRSVAESNAILWYLARDTPYLPDDGFARVQVLQWLFFEQNSHEPNIAVVRYWVALLRQPERFAQPLELRRAGGHKALAAMEKHLARHRFFVGDRYGIADISLFAYTHVAPEGGIELTAYPAVRDWLARVTGQPGFTPMLEA